MAQPSQHPSATFLAESARPALVLVLSLLATVTALLQTMVVPVLDEIGTALAVSPTAVGWAVTGQPAGSRGLHTDTQQDR